MSCWIGFGGCVLFLGLLGNWVGFHLMAGFGGCGGNIVLIWWA